MGLLNDVFRQSLEAGLANRVVGKYLASVLDRLMLPKDMYQLFTDFEAIAGNELPEWLGTADTSAAGTPTMDFVANADGGVWAMKFDTTNEVETITLYSGDHLTIDAAKTPIVEFRIKIEPDVTGAGGAFAAGDKFVVGLATARNATLDSVTAMAWFRMEGANANILVETDDGTTDTDDKDTTIDWVANTYILGRIDLSNLSDVRFYLDDVDVTPTTMSLAALTGTTNFQFFMEGQKAAATNKDHRFSIDFLDIRAKR